MQFSVGGTGGGGGGTGRDRGRGEGEEGRVAGYVVGVLGGRG